MCLIREDIQHICRAGGPPGQIWEPNTGLADIIILLDLYTFHNPQNKQEYIFIHNGRNDMLKLFIIGNQNTKNKITELKHQATRKL